MSPDPPPPRDPASDLAVSRGIELNASADEIFAALTEPDRIVRYYPVERVYSDAEVGGRFELHGAVEGEPFTDHGVIEAFDPGRRFRYNYWSTNHGTPDRPEHRMVIDYRIDETGDGCRLSLTHSNLGSAERQAMMGGVWDFLLGALRAHLE